NYERLLKKKDTISRDSGDKAAGSSVPTYRLLFPQQVRLGAGDYRIILEHIELLNDLGIEAEDFGHGTVIVRALPDFLKDVDLNSLLNDISASFLNQETKDKDQEIAPIDSIKKTIAAKIACHHSIRGRETPDEARVAKLLDDLNNTETPDFCPHGRPTRIYISLDELNKMFKRT
ncbi:MAG: hypothetical protein L0Y62_04230, partial [Nitrospirae bacterium]|nr:hypothetical protein [Nitrospirota bacterium]